MNLQTFSFETKFTEYNKIKAIFIFSTHLKHLSKQNYKVQFESIKNEMFTPVKPNNVDRNATLIV